MWNLLLLVMILLSIQGCSQIQYKHGYSFSDLGLGTKDYVSRINLNIQPYQTNELDVLKMLGSPTTISAIENDRTFFYMNSIVEQKGLLKNKIKSQNVIAISFDQDHIVKDIKNYTYNSDDKNSKHRLDSLLNIHHNNTKSDFTKKQTSFGKKIFKNYSKSSNDK